MKIRAIPTILCTVALASSVAASLVGASSTAAVISRPLDLHLSQSVGPTEATIGPEVFVATPEILWGNAAGGMVPYSWTVNAENPNPRPIVVRVNLNFVDANGQVLHQDEVSGLIDGGSSTTLFQNGSITEGELDLVAEAQGEPNAFWGDEPYQIRTLYAYANGLRTLEILFVLENWLGRPVKAAGTVDLYVLEMEQLRAGFVGGGMQRGVKQLYGRRFNITPKQFSPRRIGFMAAEYDPPAVALGPIHYSIFDDEPRYQEGLVRVVFRTASGASLTAEDRIYF